MKRIRPVHTYDDDRDYPANAEVDGGRRAALGRLFGGAALLVVGERAVDAVSKGRGYHSTTFMFSPSLYRRTCRLRVDSALVQSKDRRLVAFVRDAKERRGIDRALRPILVAAACADFTDQRRLAKLHRRLGNALAARYRARRQRATPRPIVTLNRAIRRPHPPLPGVPPHP